MKPVKLLPLLLLGWLPVAALAQAQHAPNPGEPHSGDVPDAPGKARKSRLRDIKGQVQDVNGNGIEGATVRLKDLKTGNVVSTQTKKDGSYIFYDST